MTTTATLPLAPLWRLAEVTADRHNEDGRGGFTQTLFAEMLGTTKQAVNRWMQDGRVPWVSADRAAVALGFHPAIVWGDDWWNVKGDFDRLARRAERDLEREVTEAVTAEGLTDQV